MPLRIHIPVLALTVLASCAQQSVGTLPPTDSFYFPVSVAAVEPAPGQPPVLYVVSTNYDLRYSRGTVLAVDLSKMGEPPDGPVTAAVDQTNGFAFIDNFGGEIAPFAVPGAPAGELRLFIPTRYQNRLFALTTDMPGGGAFPTLSCVPPILATQDCLGFGITLQSPTDSKVRAVDAFSVAVEGDTVFMGHLRQADDPPLSGQNPVTYIVALDAISLGVPAFIDIGTAPAEGVVATPVGLYYGGLALPATTTTTTGSTVTTTSTSQALRRLTPAGPCQTDGSCATAGAACVAGQFNECLGTADVGFTSSTQAQEARGVAVSTDGQRLFAATRSPDGLAILDISLDPITNTPKNTLLSFSTLPSGPDEIAVIPRAGERDLLAISCTTANSVAFYDDELGDATGIVEGVQEPFGMARAALPGNPDGARLFVASFGNNTVDVIDISDVSRARSAALVGHLGFSSHQPMGINLPEGPQ